MKGRQELHDSMAEVRANPVSSLFFLTPLTLACRNIGSVHEFGTPEYNALLPEGVRHAGSRAAIVLDIIKVSTVRYGDCHFYFSPTSYPPFRHAATLFLFMNLNHTVDSFSNGQQKKRPQIESASLRRVSLHRLRHVFSRG